MQKVKNFYTKKELHILEREAKKEERKLKLRAFRLRNCTDEAIKYFENIGKIK